MHDALSAMSDAYKRGRSEAIEYDVTAPHTLAIAQRKSDQGHKRLKSAQSNADLIAAAENFGFVKRVAQARNDYQMIARTHAAYGVAVGKYIFADIDIAKQEGARLLAQAGSWFESGGDLRNAAIQYTNAATLLLEKNTPTFSDFELAKKQLIFSLKHKQIGSVDYAYSQFALGIYYRRRPAPAPDAVADDLQKAVDFFNSALNLFHDAGEPIAVTGASELGEAILSLVDAQRDKEISRRVSDNAHELPAEVQSKATTSPLSVGNILISNPGALGLTHTPRWLSVDDVTAISATTVELLERAKIDIAKALGDTSSSDWQAVAAAQWAVSKIIWTLNPTVESFSKLIESLNIFVVNADPERYFRYSLYVLAQAKNANMDLDPPLILSVVETYNAIVRQRDGLERIEEFIRSRPVAIRFLACQLAGRELWSSAAQALEIGRTRLFSANISEPPPVKAKSTENVTWVYLTHSPDASYVICISEDPSLDCGRILPALNGAKLTQLVPRPSRLPL